MAALRGPDLPRPARDPLWRIDFEGVDRLREREVESWFAVANGRVGVRGSVAEGSEVSAPATYVAGIYGEIDHHQEWQELLVGPDWVRLPLTVEGEPLEPERGTVLEHRRIMDLRDGILYRLWRQRLPSGTEVTFRSFRLASLADRRLLLMGVTVTGADFRVGDDLFLPPVPGIAETADVRAEDGRCVVDLRTRFGSGATFSIATRRDGPRIDRVVGVSRRPRRGGDEGDPSAAVAAAQEAGTASVVARHRSAWRSRWSSADVEVRGDEVAQRALRFSLYHLIASADPTSDLASIGARGLTGPAYRGHVFWDTEVYMLPFFVHTHPETARMLLSYRHRTLPAARRRAADFGCRGALYAWESTDTGEETTPERTWTPDGKRVPIRTGRQEQHISADVAWGVWRAWQGMGDDDLLWEMGAEIVLETARFWASRARRGRDRRLHIGKVMGPDEYHDGVRDNAFTNRMAAWNLRFAGWVWDRLEGLDPRAWQELARRVKLRPQERSRWDRMADGLVDGFDAERGLHEQFAGYFRLRDLRAREIAEPPFPAPVLLGFEALGRSQLLKQPDVVMLAHMLPEEIDPGIAEADFRYYEPRTSHGSSLSPSVHAAVAARVGDLDTALRYFHMAAGIDLVDGMGNAAKGVHLAAAGGLWQAAVMGFGGFRPDDDGLRLDPRLPDEWEELAFPLRWRGTTIRVRAARNRLSLSLDGPARVALGDGPPADLRRGRYRAVRRAGRWGRLRPAGEVTGRRAPPTVR